MGVVENIITDNLPIWSSTVKSKSSAGRGTSSKRKLYGVKKLRELILDLAVRGLLVPQDSNDESVSFLLEKITSEKDRLFGEGKIKKNVQPLNVESGDVPFHLPKNWSWARLPTVCYYNVGKTPPTKNPAFWSESPAGVPWVSIADMNHYGSIKTTKKHVSNAAVEEVFKHAPIKAGTILMSFKLTLGKIAKLEIDSFHNEAIISVYPFQGVLQDYLFQILPAQAQAGNSKAAIKGDTLNSESLAAILIPVPPFAEQCSIVAKVDELMALCDTLEQQQEDSIQAHETLVEALLEALTSAVDADAFQSAWKRISKHFDVLFTTEHSIDKLKETILQLAVMGKLVPQDPNDEPASVLLKRVAVKKDKFVKEGKLKTHKVFPVIDDEPFAKPLGWQFCRLNSLVSKLGSGSTPRGGRSAYKQKGIPFLRSQNVWNDGLHLDDIAFISEETHAAMSNTHVYPDDILLNITGASLGRSAIFPNELKTANVSQHVTIIRLVDSDMGPFLHLVTLSPYVQKLVWARQVGMAIEGLSKKVLEQFEIPVPPLAEQHRIVAKVDELMALCDQLKESLQQAQQTQIHLTDAVVENAL